MCWKCSSSFRLFSSFLFDSSLSLPLSLVTRPIFFHTPPHSPHSAPDHLHPDSAQVSKGALADVHRCCALLASEVLRRCTHKDMTAEYRGVAVALQEEVGTALLCADWPVAAVLHDHWVRRLTADLAANISTSGGAYSGREREGDASLDKEGKEGGKDGKGRKDPSFVSFLMDQLGAVAVGIRRVILDAERVRGAQVLLVCSPACGCVYCDLWLWLWWWLPCDCMLCR